MNGVDRTTPVTDETMAALGVEVARMRNWQLWLLDMTPNEQWPDLSTGMPEHFAATLVEHLKWLEQLEADDALVLSGPIDLDTGLGPGLSIIRASTSEEVEAMSAGEPFARAGYRTNAIRSWTVNEGSLNVRIRLMANKIVL